MSDPATYRTKEELENVKNERDPITNFKNFILQNSEISESSFKTIDKEIKTLMKEVVRFSKDSLEPDLSELMTDVLLDV
jgi:pyruvate dehydrogenase E1 component alpha subunit